MDKPEILSPAGDPERLKMAVTFGANAVYLAGKQFGMRGGVPNFTEEQLRWAVGVLPQPRRTGACDGQYLAARPRAGGAAGVSVLPGRDWG